MVFKLGGFTVYSKAYPGLLGATYSSHWLMASQDKNTCTCTNAENHTISTLEKTIGWALHGIRNVSLMMVEALLYAFTVFTSMINMHL